MLGRLFRRKPQSTPKRTWGVNPDCPSCGSRLVTLDIQILTMYCPIHKRVFQCKEWPVAADYFKKMNDDQD